MKLYVPIRSVQPSRNSVKLLYVPIRSYYVPIRSECLCHSICNILIRSYTFRATLSRFCEIVIRSYTFLLRSYTFRLLFQRICHIVIRSYTFRATVSHIRNTSQKVETDRPFSLRRLNGQSHIYIYICIYIHDIHIQFSIFCWKVIRSYTFRATLSLFCEIGIRSYTFLLRSYTFFHMFLNILLKRYTFLYVPCNSVANPQNVPDFRQESTF